MPKHAAHDAPHRGRHAAHDAVDDRLRRQRVVVGVCATALVALAVAGIAAARMQEPRSPEQETAAPAASEERPAPESGATRSAEPSDGADSSDEAVDAPTADAVVDTPETRLASCASYAPAPEDIARLSESDKPFAFSLNPDDAHAAPALPAETASRLEDARTALDGGGARTGYLLIDLGSGRGLASNLDARAYGASSIKGPFAAYACETMLDTGRATRDTPCAEGAAAAFMDGPYLTDGTASYPLGTLVEDSIVLSDNDSYRILRANLDGGFNAWLDGIGFPRSVNDNWYPTYSARESALLWLHTADYVDGDGKSAAWLSSLLARTETSFLRDALADQGVVVRDKAGWYADGDPAFCGISDAGIVQKDGRSYLLCMMSPAPYSEENAALFERLAAAVFAAREDLA